MLGYVCFQKSMKQYTDAPSYSLLARNDDAVQQLGPKTIRIVSGDLIVAGSDTTATGLSVVLSLMSSNL